MTPHHLLLMLGMNLVWAFTLIIMKVVIGHVSPIWFMVLRFGLTSLILIPVFRLHKGQMPLLFALAMTAGGLQFAFFFTGLNLAEDVSAISVVGQLATPFAVLLSVIFFGEQVHWRRWTGIGLAFFGITYVSFDPRVFSYIDGVVLSLIGALIGAISLLLMQRVKNVGVFELQGWIALFSWPVLLPLAFLFEGDPTASIREAPYYVWGGLIVTVLISNLGAHGALYYLLQRYPVSLVSPLLLLAPIFTIIFGITLLEDQVSPQMIFGMLIALTGVAIVTMRQPEIIKEKL